MTADADGSGIIPAKIKVPTSVRITPTMNALQSLHRSVRIWTLLLAFGIPLVAVGEESATKEKQGPFLFSTPPTGQPTTVYMDFQLDDINAIHSVDETFEFTGTMTLTWVDPRVAFDPQELGVEEIIYQGNYQFNEIATGWYPQVVLVNEAGSLQRSGVQLRIHPDGTSILKEKLTAVAEAKLDMHAFPFDNHRLEAVFELLGHDTGEIDLKISPSTKGFSEDIQLPAWSLDTASLTIKEKHGDAGEPSRQLAVFAVDAHRQSFYIRRMINLPMALIVLLSFSIFWMDKSSLSDRNSVSFIGILTAVAYQQIVVDVMPPTSYFNFMHGALTVSFLIMSTTVPINFIVASMDKRGRHDIGDRIDQIGRWLFPALYFGSVFLIYLYTTRSR